MIEEDGHESDVVESEQKVAFERQKTLEEYFAPEPPRDMSYAITSESGSGSEDNSDWLISDHDDSAVGQDLEVWLRTYTSISTHVQRILIPIYVNYWYTPSIHTIQLVSRVLPYAGIL